MCAVFGFLDYKEKVSNAVLKKLIHYLSVAAEARGTDATGIAYVRDGSIVTYKKPKLAHKVKLFFPRDTGQSSDIPGSRPRAARSGTATTTRSRDAVAQRRSPSPTTACCTTTGSFAGNSISHRHQSKTSPPSCTATKNTRNMRLAKCSAPESVRYAPSRCPLLSLWMPVAPDKCICRKKSAKSH